MNDATSLPPDLAALAEQLRKNPALLAMMGLQQATNAKPEKAPPPPETKVAHKCRGCGLVTYVDLLPGETPPPAAEPRAPFVQLAQLVADASKPKAAEPKADDAEPPTNPEPAAAAKLPAGTDLSKANPATLAGLGLTG